MPWVNLASMVAYAPVGKGDAGAVAVSGVGVQTINGIAVPNASQVSLSGAAWSPAINAMLESKCGQQPRIVSGIQVFISHLDLFAIFREPSFGIG